ncbi:MAG: hypothetical protein Q3971_08330, partial [Moraxella sp.]|nr:hypothetical protein [Moraxella sp.]
ESLAISQITEMTNNQHSQTNPTTNKARLMGQLLAPQVELSGQWTAEKWDYWVSQARQQAWLSADELALVSRAVMTGQIDGQCTLNMPSQNKQAVASFNNFAKKYARIMPKAHLSGYELWGDDASENATPATKQIQRQESVAMAVEQQLLNSPVLTHLWQMGYIEPSGASIGAVKLLL